MKYPFISGMELSIVDGPVSYLRVMKQKIFRRILRNNSHRINLSIGDYMLKRDSLSHMQFGIAALCLDIERYLKSGDASFYYQNVSKAHWYGKDYDTSADDLRFRETLDSIVSQGYNPDSFVELDRDITIQNGTHRTAILLCLHQYSMCGLRFAYRYRWFENADKYVKYMSYEPQYIADILTAYDKIEQELIDAGATFALYVPNDSSDVRCLLNDENTIRLLRKTDLSAGGVFYQFMFLKPDYRVDGTSIVSRAAERLERELKKKGLSDFIIAKNCTDGARVFSELVNN